eukprot:3215516-Karenia_brevis.AAC.1
MNETCRKNIPLDDGLEPDGQEIISVLEARTCEDRLNCRSRVKTANFADFNHYIVIEDAQYPDVWMRMKRREYYISDEGADGDWATCWHGMQFNQPLPFSRAMSSEHIVMRAG